jgi:hypothetical protein
LVAQLSGRNTWIDDAISGWINGSSSTELGSGVPKFVTWFSKNYAYSILLLLPLFSLASYLSFFSFGKNYLEHIVLNSYITGQQAIFYSFFTLLGKVFDSQIFEFLPFLLAVGYAFWVFWQFFSEGNRLVNLLRSMLTYLLYLIFCTVFFGLVLKLGGFE